jgi:hypothetical protein
MLKIPVQTYPGVYISNRSAILSSNQKRQKILLRIVKRIITADKANLELFKVIGQNFIENLRSLNKLARCMHKKN